jgi:signal transduction histidine kinase
MAGALVARDLPEELGFAAALVLAAVWIGRNLFLRRQVAALRKVTERLAAGDLTARAGTSQCLGELGDLGRALDAMAASLEARIAENARFREAAEAAERRSTFLAHASEVLARTLDLDTILTDLAHLAVSSLADGCAVDLVTDDGQIQRMAVAARDPAHTRLIETLQLRCPPESDRSAGVPEVIRTGQPQFVADLPPHCLESIAHDAEHLELLRQIGVRAFMIVPLQTRGRTVGALSLVALGPGRDYGPADLALAQELAGRAAIAIDHARLYRAAQQATRTRDEVLAIVSHDLRNPVNLISISAGLVLERLGEDEPARKHIQMIQRSVEQMNGLIQDLLDTVKLEAGCLVIEPQPQEVASLVAEALELHRLPAAEKRLWLEVRMPERLPCIHADRQRILQVFSNLIGNAIKFTPEGGQIVVQAEQSGREVRFAVQDTGPGIAEEDLPRAFDRYWQATHARRGGAGLGLSIAKGIVEAHGGRIWIESAKGAGCTFFFTIPASTAPEGWRSRAA